MIHSPKHPGRMVKSLCIEPLNLTLTEASNALKVARPTLSKLINGHMRISPEMAIRLATVFDTSALFWIDLQAAYDFHIASKNTKRLYLKPIRQHTERKAAGR